MTQTSNSQPTWPVYTFQVNLETLARQSSVQPVATQLHGNQTVTEADNLKYTRSSWLCSLLPGQEFIMEGENFQFTAYGQKALYYKNTYITNGKGQSAPGPGIGAPGDLLIWIS